MTPNESVTAAAEAEQAPVMLIRAKAWVNVALLDPIAMHTLADRRLGKRLASRNLEISEVRPIVENYITGLFDNERQFAMDPLEVHQRLTTGLPGDALIIASSLLLDNQKDAASYFDLSFKTFKSRIGQTLSTQESELALRIIRVVTAAMQVLGSFDDAREYLRIKNFALGGAQPVDLLRTSEGERLVLNELQAQAEGGPI